MLVVVLSGTLEVLVYAADDLPYLRPTYGNAPCLPGGDSKHVDDDDKGESGLLDPTRGEASGPQLPLGAETLGLERNDAQSRPEESDQQEEGAKKTLIALAENYVPEKTNGGKVLDNWPHEPRYCANVWPTEEGHDDGRNTTGAQPTRLVFLSRIFTYGLRVTNMRRFV